MSQIQSIDQKIVLSLNGFLAEHSSNFWNKFFGEYLIYGLPILLVALFFFGKNQKTAMRAFFSVILAWPIFGFLIGHLVNRARPFEVGGIQELLFHRPDYSFPSDHAAAIFAVAASFWFSKNKKLSVAVGIAGLVISFFRISLGFHFPTDILSGIALGIISAYLIDLFDKPLDIIYNFILKTTKILRLS